MAFQTVKLVVHRLFADDRFRSEFVGSPDAVLGALKPNPEEWKALLQLRTRLATAGGPRVAPLEYWP